MTTVHLQHNIMNTIMVVLTVIFYFMFLVIAVHGFLSIATTSRFRQQHGLCKTLPILSSCQFHGVSNQLLLQLVKSNGENDEESLLKQQQYNEFQRILPFVKQRASTQLYEEFMNILESNGETWYDRPDLQEEFITQVEHEQVRQKVHIEKKIQQTYPTMYEYYLAKANEESEANQSLLTISPVSATDSGSEMSLAEDRPELMMRMEQEYKIWELMESEIKSLAPDLYEQVHEELRSEQQQRRTKEQEEENREIPLSNILMERKDLIQQVNTKVNELRKNVENITAAVMKPKKGGGNRKKKGKTKNNNKKGFG